MAGGAAEPHKAGTEKRRNLPSQKQETQRPRAPFFVIWRKAKQLGS